MEKQPDLQHFMEHFSEKILKEMKLCFMQMELSNKIRDNLISSSFNDLKNKIEELRCLYRKRSTRDVGTNTEEWKLKDAEEPQQKHRKLNDGFNDKLLTLLHHKISKSTVNLDVFLSDQQKADYIGRLIEDKFSPIVNGLSASQNKVIAGIAMTRNNIKSETKIIALSMGTKCILGRNLSERGEALNDMHAEITVRRCLLYFLYQQLESIALNLNHSSIFTLDESGIRYKLKEEIEFHLYVNKCPCGDASISSKKTKSAFLRCKIEAGEGNIRVKETEQSWSKLLNMDDRLITMSCSDKICKWNVVGLQGALLSHFVQPIYLKSVIIGSCVKKELLQRAFYQRVENCVNDLPPLYRLNRPSIFITETGKTLNGKGPSMCVNWSIATSIYETISTKTGKLLNNSPSTYCKQELFKKFLYLIDKVPSSLKDKFFYEDWSYAYVKNSAIAYNQAKDCLYRAFEERQLGKWVSKPHEQDAFDLHTEL